jgi:Flp pilus assembly protein TadD
VDARRLTFHQHIAPIVERHCVSCHRDGGIGPFPLVTYADVVAEASTIEQMVQARRMPPWLPAPGEFPLKGVRRLSDQDIDLIRRWRLQGMAEGTASAPPTLPPSSEWEHGTPDVTVSMARPWVAPTTGPDVYRQLVLQTAISRPVYVQAVEMQTHGAPIHHAVIRLDRTSGSRRRDGRDGAPGFSGMAWGASDPAGQFLGWAPGRGPIVSPDGMAWRLDPGTDFVVEVHVVPGAATGTTRVAPTIGLYLTDTPPTRTPVTLKLGSKVIDIPAGKTEHVISADAVLPAPVTLLGLYPHAHYLAARMSITATWPDGSSRSLLEIPRWDFHWQQDYQFETPVALPAGTRVSMRYVYDNSSANRHNPSTPPRRVRAGPEATDEMAELLLQVLPVSASDADALVRTFAQYEQQDAIAFGQYLVAADAQAPEGYAVLGGSLVQAGRSAEAIPHLETALRLGDRSAATQADLGSAFSALGQADRALPFFQRAVALAADDEVLQTNLGTTLAALGRATEAERVFRRALALNGAYLDAHVNLGALLMAGRRYRDALAHFQAAADGAPGTPMMHTNLAGAYMALGRSAEAAAAARRALALDPAYAPALDTLRRLGHAR